MAVRDPPIKLKGPQVTGTSRDPTLRFDIEQQVVRLQRGA